MFKHILVAVDGSAASNAGLRTALRLCGDARATLIVLNVIEDMTLAVGPDGSFYPGEYLDQMYEAQAMAAK